MGKSKIRVILTFVYSVIISGILCYLLYLISLRVRMDFKESLFLIALVLVLIGIVVLISRNPRFVNSLKTKQSRDDSEDMEVSDKDVKLSTRTMLSGFNSFTIFLAGIFLLIVDSFLK